MKRKTKIIGISGGTVLFLYLVVAGCFYFFQDRFVFQPEYLSKNFKFVFNQNFEEYSIQTKDHNTLNALYFTTDQPSKGLILYFHGNAGNLKKWGRYAVDFTSLGYDVFMADYRGYGKSTGKPSEEVLYQDAQEILDWTKANLKYDKLVIYGRSLGSAVASHLSMTANPALLILETPFEKLSGVIYYLPSNYDFPNNQFLPKVRCKKLFIHGTDDWIVPLASAAKLKPFLNEGDRFVFIEGGGHNNLREFKKYHETLREALN
jgi:fermentation-respiration switch protein FrsA (DUF1100 family)